MKINLSKVKQHLEINARIKGKKLCLALIPLLECSVKLQSCQSLSIHSLLYSNISVKTYDVGAEKNRLSETVHLSTHNICFRFEMREITRKHVILTVVGSIAYQLPDIDIRVSSLINGTKLKQVLRDSGIH